MRRVLCTLGIAVLVTRATVASAYCRTTTVHEPVPFDPVVSGCWTEGTPLAWAPSQRISYSISRASSADISLADATRIAHLAFDAWNTADCGGGAHPDVQVYDGGPIAPQTAAGDCGINPCDPGIHDPIHSIVFDDRSWPFDDPNNTLAMTTVTYGVDSGEIFDADIQINTAQHAITAEEPPPRRSNMYDLQSILTHEAGHFLGLAHATSTVPIMYAQYQPDHVTLTQDDVDAVCAVYPPADSGGCSCWPTPASGGSSGAGAGLGVVVLALARWVRRRRPPPP